MKYRIVETKDGNGKSWFEIQEKWLWWWSSLVIAEIYRLGELCGSIFLDYKCFRFDSREEAESALKRVIKEYSYKGVPIYPTIDPNEFYVKKWSRFGRNSYDYLIYGSYEYCCKKIDCELKAKEMRKFRKIINVNIDEI